MRKNKVLLVLAFIAIIVLICSIDLIASLEFGIKSIPAIVSLIYLVLFMIANRHKEFYI